MNLHRLSRRSTVVTAIVAATLVGGGVAYAATAQPAIQTSTPNTADQVTNVDVLRQQIRNYYGDPLGSGTFAADSNYAREAEKVASEGSSWLKAKAPTAGESKAIVLDVDDTTLTTWNYELASNWAYNPTTNAAYVNGQLFPATPGMVDMVTTAAAEGYAIFFVTGRPATQAAATLGNLGSDGIGVDAGYPTPTQLFTKPAVVNYPPYLQAACANDPNGVCTTTHYKSATRAYIESQGYDIVANFGDQYSDLNGGFADRTFKMPNPNYYLP
jgi:hypothetical protein